jgi:hypothetical protein
MNTYDREAMAEGRAIDKMNGYRLSQGGRRKSKCRIGGGGFDLSMKPVKIGGNRSVKKAKKVKDTVTLAMGF